MQQNADYVIVEDSHKHKDLPIFFQLWYDGEWHLRYVNNIDQKPPNVHIHSVKHKNLFEWIQKTYKKNRVSGVTNLRTWCGIMFFLQIASLLLMTFEGSSLVDENNIIYYVSDNIARHIGFGCLMLLSFTGSLFLISVTASKESIWVQIPVYTCLMTCVAGGIGVVAFHHPYATQHLISAAVFIGSAIVLQIIVITRRLFWTHLVRDVFLMFMTCAAGICFLTCVVLTRRKANTRDPSMAVEIWIAATSEYILYLYFCILNFLAYERVIECEASHFQRQLQRRIEVVDDIKKIFLPTLPPTYTNFYQI